jgi:DNA-binding CsgD family transcriptional regulator/tetratricopeptide (TPR) repeat protein
MLHERAVGRACGFRRRSTIRLVRAGSAASAAAAGELLERAEALAALEVALARVSGGSGGRFLFVGGEAGVGKTVLLRGFCARHAGSTRVLWGACDALATPRPLGPFLDFGEVAGDELRVLLDGHARPHRVAAALLRELAAGAPAIVVLEDVHWADEATLDVVRLLARRLGGVPALVLASYRDDQLGRAHPLRVVLGELATVEAVARFKLHPLSAEAVATLARPAGVDADELYRKTGGNPFFVTEALASGGEEIPPTVRDAVLARCARVSAGARALLDAVAVVPSVVEPWLLDALVEETNRLDECLASGMLTAVLGGVVFRHEFARLAVEGSLAPNKKAALHRRALAALAEPPAGAPEPARLAHHAEAAGDADAVLEFATAAGALAAARGAHLQAAEQYERALRLNEGLPPEVRAELLGRRSHECYVTDLYDEAIETGRQAIACYRQLGDRLREGDGFRSLAQMLWSSGSTTEADRAAREAVTLLEQLRPGRELALAYSVLASRCMNADDLQETLLWGSRALELATRLGEVEIVAHALNTLATAELLAGSPVGVDKLEESREFAEREGLDEQMARAFANSAWAAVRTRFYDLVNDRIDSWLDRCADRGLELWRLYLLAYRARAELDQGRWTAAVDSAASVLRVPRTSALPRIHALVVLGLVRARRGDPGASAALDEALALTEPNGELQRIEPVAAARAEVAWLEGRREAVVAATGAALELAVRCRAPWEIGELAVWRRRTGIVEATPAGAAAPYACQLVGDWQGAALRWSELGCPYEAALALADADDEQALRRALAELQALAARPAADIVARRLRERGARGLPRGPRPVTRQNPANLTPRELEVLTLVAQGLHNREIAERLFLSPKTVDRHVSVLLSKLGARTRVEATAEAVRLGIADQDR